MSLTPSNMLPLGTKAPDFTLLDTRTGNQISLAELQSDIATVVMFICNHCPYVKHIQNKMVEISQHYQTKGISFIAISSNDAKNYPQDGPEAMQAEAADNNYSFPYLYDETQSVAKAYHAACTPDFFIFDKALLCVYRGRFDASTPGNGEPVTGDDLSAALNAIIDGEMIKSTQHPSHGCNIKWHK